MSDEARRRRRLVIAGYALLAAGAIAVPFFFGS
jgi:hypothetical protein